MGLIEKAKNKTEMRAITSISDRASSTVNSTKIKEEFMSIFHHFVNVRIWTNSRLKHFLGKLGQTSAGEDRIKKW